MSILRILLKKNMTLVSFLYCRVLSLGLNYLYLSSSCIVRLQESGRAYWLLSWILRGLILPQHFHSDTCWCCNLDGPNALESTAIEKILKNNGGIIKFICWLSNLRFSLFFPIRTMTIFFWWLLREVGTLWTLFSYKKIGKGALGIGKEPIRTCI